MFSVCTCVCVRECVRVFVRLLPCLLELNVKPISKPLIQLVEEIRGGNVANANLSRLQ